MPKALTDMQRVILAHAATRDDGRIFPVPSSLNKNAGAIGLCLRATSARGLVAEVPASRGDVAWVTTPEGEHYTLVITELGLAAIGLTDTDQPSLSSSQLVTPQKAPADSGPAPRTGSKLELLIARLSQVEGATLEELMAITGWQKHSVRGAISGALKTRRKLDVTSTVVEGRGRVYRIPASAENDVELALVGSHVGDAQP